MTFLDSAGDGLLKTDTVGRVRVPRERREQLLREFANSGISARRFAQLAGVNPVTFYSWVQKERARKPSVVDGGRPVSFMEAVLDCSPKMGAGAEAPLVCRHISSRTENGSRFTVTCRLLIKGSELVSARQQLG